MPLAFTRPSFRGCVRLKVWSWCSRTTSTLCRSNSGTQCSRLAAPVPALSSLGLELAVRRVGRDVVDRDQVGPIGPLGEDLVEPGGLLAADRGDVPGVQQDQAQVVAEVERREAALGVEAVVQGEVERGVLARLAVAAVDLVIADADDHRDQPPPGVDHVPAIVAHEFEAGFALAPVVIPEVAADQGEHRFLRGGQDVVGDGVLVHAAVAAGDELEGVGRPGGHRAEPVGRRVPADLEEVLGPRPQAGHLGPEDVQVGHRVGVLLRGDRPPEGLLAGLGEPDRDAVGRGRGDPLDRHGRRRVAPPGEEQRIRLPSGPRGRGPTLAPQGGPRGQRRQATESRTEECAAVDRGHEGISRSK